MLSNPDHLATQIFVLAAWLIVDRARPRWWVPVAVAVAAGLGPDVRLDRPARGRAPLLVVCAVRIYRRGGALRDQWYELSLGAAAIAAELIAQLVLVTIRAMGGFTAYPLQESFAPVSQLSSHIWVTVESTLILYGADFSGLALKGNVTLITVAAHLIGVALAVGGTIYALRRFTSIDLVPQVVTAMMVTSALAYTLLSQGVTAIGGAHDVMQVCRPGRSSRALAVGARIPRRLLAVVAAGLALYALLLARYAIHVPRSPNQKPLAAWLRRHNLRFGLSNYYAAALITVDGNNQVMIARSSGSDATSCSARGSRRRPGTTPLSTTPLLRRDPAERLPGGRRRLWARPRSGPTASRARPTRWTASRSWSGTSNLLDTAAPGAIGRPSAC